MAPKVQNEVIGYVNTLCGGLAYLLGGLKTMLTKSNNHQFL